MTQSEFSQGFVHWLRKEGYQVGLMNIDEYIEKLKKQVNDTEKMSKVMNVVSKTMTQEKHQSSVAINIDKDQIVQGITPFLSLADVLGFQIGTSNEILPMIYCDDLTTNDIVKRFDNFLNVASPMTRIGISTNTHNSELIKVLSETFAANSPKCSVTVIPVLIYFNEDKYNGSIKVLLSKASHGSFWGNIHLNARFVNVPKKLVIKPEEGVLSKALSSIGEIFGGNPYRFTEKELEVVLGLANKDVNVSTTASTNLERRFPMSNSIFDAVVEFFQKDEWNVKQIEEKPALRMGYQGYNGSWTCIARVREEQKQFIFLSILGANAPSNKLAAMAEFLTRANFGLNIGNFEMDYSDGEIRYRTSISADGGTLTYQMIKDVVYINIIMMDKYFPGIMSVMYAGISPADAIAKIEGEES